MKSSNTIKRDFAVAVGAASKAKLQQLARNLAAATPRDTGEAAAGWRVEGRSIVNDVPHIVQLNEGHSPQAKPHFVESTVLATEGVHPNGNIVRTTR